MSDDAAPSRQARGADARVLPYVAWATLGAASAASLWTAASVPGAIGMFACIGAAFAMWHVLGSRGSWLAVVVLGVAMSSVLGWQAATGARCPTPGTTVTLKDGKPPVGCAEIRASAGTFAVLFGMFALVGIAAPFYARRTDEPALDADER